MKAAAKPARKPLSIKEIRADVEHCLSIEDENDPCTHCRQKLFLLQYIDDQAKDADGLNDLATTAMKTAGMIPGEKINVDEDFDKDTRPA